MGIKIPSNFRYTETHEWAKKSNGKTVLIGITEYAVHELGDIVFLELPEIEQEIERGETFGTIESVKAVSDLVSPISGKIIQVNEGIQDAPEELADTAYDDGWLIEIEVDDISELDDLMTAEEYISYIQKESEEEIEIVDEE